MVQVVFVSVVVVVLVFVFVVVFVVVVFVVVVLVIWLWLWLWLWLSNNLACPLTMHPLVFRLASSHTPQAANAAPLMRPYVSRNDRMMCT